jgi:hypothetical protein
MLVFCEHQPWKAAKIASLSGEFNFKIKTSKRQTGYSMIVKRLQLFAAVTLTLAFFGCQPDEKRQVPDVSDIEMDIKIRRFEQDLFQGDTVQMAATLDSLEQAYPEFSAIFFNQLMGINDPRIAPQGPIAFMKGFVQHPPVQQLYDSIRYHYGDMREVEADFEQAFRYFRHYFPEQPTPTVTTFLSEYAIAAFVYGDNDVAVALDYFLGEDYPYQKINPSDPAFSGYMVRTFNREHLVSKAIQAMIGGLVAEPKQRRLLDLMVNNGKKLYILDQLMPYTPDSIKLEVTAAQSEWLEDNELEMWAYFLKEELFYSEDWQEIRKFVDYSPHSPGMPPEAPGRTANFMGWQIIKAYMKRHPETTLPELLEMTDAQKLLDASRYKPR